jgi:hypothetical protein
LRRAFCSLNGAERVAIARRMKSAQPGASARRQLQQAEALDSARVARVVPVLAKILGVDHV